MKKLSIFGLFLVALIIAIFLFLRWSSYSKDLKVREKLSGTWIWEFYNIRATNIITSDGHFKTDEVINHSGKTKIVQNTGTLQVKNGILIRTSDHENPHIARGHIVQIDNYELIVKWDGADTNSIWRKIQ